MSDTKLAAMVIVPFTLVMAAGAIMFAHQDERRVELPPVLMELDIEHSHSETAATCLARHWYFEGGVCWNSDAVDAWYRKFPERKPQ